MLADDAEHDAGDLAPRRAPIALDGVGERQRRARRARRCRRGRPSMPDSAVLAVPEPMLASSRSASSWRSVYSVLTEGPFALRRDEGGDVASTSASQSTIRAIWPSDSTAPPERAAPLGDLGRQRAGDQLVLADQLRDGEREARRRPPRTITA